jgi:probable rRNA maturation factor
MTARKHRPRLPQTRSRPRWHIEIADRQNFVRIPKKLLRRLIVTVLAGENRPGCQLSLALVDDQVITDLHQRFLGLATPTDVLTFPLDDDVGNSPNDSITSSRNHMQATMQPARNSLNQGDTSSRIVCGEIVISTQTALRQARQRRHDPATETLLYVIHGLLHLCGYDDTTPTARRMMQRRQLHYLHQLGLRLRQPPSHGN